MAEYRRGRKVHERLMEFSQIGLVLANPNYPENGLLGNEIPHRSDVTMSATEFNKNGCQRLGAEPKRAQIARIDQMYTYIKDRFMYLGSISRSKSIYSDDFGKTSAVSCDVIPIIFHSEYLILSVI